MLRKPQHTIVISLGMLGLATAMLLAVLWGRAVHRPNLSSMRSSQDIAMKIDINKADAASLSLLPGMGPKTAMKVIAHRQAHGPFTNEKDITKVKGIGPQKFARFQKYIICTAP